MRPTDLRIAMVVQRYGREVNGGAEAHCRMLAEHLARRAEVAGVTVLTTCARDHFTWTNEYPPGSEILEGVTVERFPVVVPRFVQAQNRLASLVMNRRLWPLEPLWLLAQGPFAPGILRRLIASRWGGARGFDVFVFFTYLYFPTVIGLPLVRDRAVLVPTAHDEPPIYLRTYRFLFRQPSAFAYNTPEERALVEGHFGVGHVPSAVVGCGVDLDPEDPGAPPGLAGPFVLYLGRVDHEKGFPDLFAAFRAFKERHGADVFQGDGGPFRGKDLRLVLAGRAGVDLPSDPDIVPLGFVDDARKVGLLRACEVLLMPSRFESLSLVLLEAWRMGKPALVNAACAATRGQVERSRGGLTYGDDASFATALASLLADPTRRRSLGRAGSEFVRENYAWDKVEDRFLSLLARLKPARAARTGR